MNIAQYYAHLRTIVSNIVFASLMLLIFSSAMANSRPPTQPVGMTLSPAQAESVQDVLHSIRTAKLTLYADLADKLYALGQIRAATPDDVWIKGSEKAGDTPFAYTMPDDSHPHSPIAIVLAPRFFSETTSTARAATLLHELGHWRAYLTHGKSDEYDGYKTEYDTHNRIGLTSKDGLSYFMMLDGVAEYVVPRDKSYKDFPDVKAYMSGN